MMKRMCRNSINCSLHAFADGAGMGLEQEHIPSPAPVFPRKHGRDGWERTGQKLPLSDIFLRFSGGAGTEDASGSHYMTQAGMSVHTHGSARLHCPLPCYKFKAEKGKESVP